MRGRTANESTKSTGTASAGVRKTDEVRRLEKTEKGWSKTPRGSALGDRIGLPGRTY